MERFWQKGRVSIIIEAMEEATNQKLDVERQSCPDSTSTLPASRYLGLLLCGQSVVAEAQMLGRSQPNDVESETLFTNLRHRQLAGDDGPIYVLVGRTVESPQLG